MADGISVRMTGTDDMMKKLKKYSVIKREAVKIALMEGAFKIEATAKKKVRVDTGRLKGGIHTDISKINLLAVRVGVDDPAIHYAIYQEFGTYKMAAHPFLYPAYFMHHYEIIKNIGGVFKK